MDAAGDGDHSRQLPTVYAIMRPMRRARRRVEYDDWEWDFSGESQDSQSAEPDGQAAQVTRPPVLRQWTVIESEYDYEYDFEAAGTGAGGHGQGADLDGGVAVGSKRGRAAASAKAILGLEEVKASGAAQTECAVCLKEFGAEKMLRAMPCAHAFHQECIFGWLRRNGVCPLCRHQLPTQQQEDE